MSTITIPASLKSAFEGMTQARVCDENGNTLGYFSTRREATEEDYEWAMKRFTAEEIEAAENSGPCRPASEIIPELIRKYGL
jgi:hypothetical protein